MRVEEPASANEAAKVLRSVGAEGLAARFKGGGTKLAWGNPIGEPDVVIGTAKLDRILEHNAADLTAVLEAGVPLAAAQKSFAEAGQMLALDPPLGAAEAATIGGIVATGDSGPLRHRYGAARDLLLGVTVALSDGTVAKSGGKVIKNVAGYDLAKLFTGSFGTLGAIVRMAVRLHPLPARCVTAVGHGEEPSALQRAAIELARSPLELERLDLTWQGGKGGVLARMSGAAPETRAKDALRVLSEAGLHAELEVEDWSLWDRQRHDQRSAEGTVVRVSALPDQLSRILQVVERLQGSVVARAGMGLCWVSLPPQDTQGVVAAIEDLRFTLAPSSCVVLDAPDDVRAKLDVWGVADGPAVELMRRVKASFDPSGTCNPGVFVGGI